MRAFSRPSKSKPHTINVLPLATYPLADVGTLSADSVGEMFRVSVTEKEGAIQLDVEGRLAGPWVAELKDCWQRERAKGGKPVSVSLCAVTFIDDAGKELLKSMSESGTELEGRGCLVRAILQRIRGHFES